MRIDIMSGNQKITQLIDENIVIGPDKVNALLESNENNKLKVLK